jgi:CO/xanthine dehydrogenase FAD-binding subunit
VGVAACGSSKGGLRAAFFGVGDRPKVLEADAADGVLSKVESGLEPRADLHASAAMKLHLAKVLAGRVLKQLAA